MRLQLAAALAVAVVVLMFGAGCPPSTTCASCGGGDGGGNGGGSGKIKTGKMGSACDQDSDCGAGGLCDTTVSGGYCTKICSGQVSTTDAPCPTEAACIGVNEATSICLATCSATAVCRTGYVCLNANGPNVCLPGCTSNTDCSAGTGCNTATGLCDAAHWTPGGVGSPCTANSDCASNGCVIATSYPGGYCTKRCTDAQAADNTFCDNNDGICLGVDTTTNACFASCTTSVECRAEYTCTASAGIRNAAGYGICLPRCNYYACSDGYVCDLSVGLCLPAGTGTADGGVGGVRHVAVGTSATFSVQMNSDDTALALVITPSDLATSPSVSKVTAPNGHVIFDSSNPWNSELRVLALGNGVQGLLLPNTPRVTPMVGSYAFQVSTRSSVTVDGFIRRGNANGGTIAVNFWFFHGQGPTAASAQTDAKLTQAIANWRRVYGSLGITLDPITYNNVPEPMGTQLASITDQEAQEPDLMQVASSKTGLNIFFVDQITAPGLKPGQTLLGSSRGIPGAYSSPGVGHSGIVLNYLAIGDATQLGHVMAHEAGHYLGLFHTTEQPGTMFDPLLDTPECPSSRDTNKNGIVDSPECVGVGADYMMFWEADDTRTQDTVSAEQKFVLLHNPMVQ